MFEYNTRYVIECNGHIVAYASNLKLAKHILAVIYDEFDNVQSVCIRVEDDNE